VVNRSLSALAALFILVATAIETGNLLNFFAPLIPLDGEAYLRALYVEQLPSLAYAFLDPQAIGFHVAVVFFAFYDLGYLVLRSTFLPRVLGVLMAIGGFCYLTDSVANFLSPVALPLAFGDWRERSEMGNAGQRNDASAGESRRLAVQTSNQFRADQGLRSGRCRVDSLPMSRDAR
jgi:hypothetical protein